MTDASVISGFHRPQFLRHGAFDRVPLGDAIERNARLRGDIKMFPLAGEGAFDVEQGPVLRAKVETNRLFTCALLFAQS